MAKYFQMHSLTSSLPYAERLAFLDLEILELRRFRFNLIYYYNYLMSHVTTFNLATLLLTHLMRILGSADARQSYQPTTINDYFLHKR